MCSFRLLLLVLGLCICTKRIDAGVAISISELIDHYQRASAQCMLPADYTVDKATASSFLLEKLSRCGFAVVRDVVDAQTLNELRQEIIQSAPVIDFDAQTYDKSGTVHLTTKATKRVEATLKPILDKLVTLERPPSIISDFSANFYSGPSQDVGSYSRYPFVFPNNVLRQFQVSSADAAFSYRIDAYIATQSLSGEPLIDVCVGSHVLAGLESSEECSTFQAASPKRSLCEFLAGTNQCLKENMLRIQQVNTGDVVLVSYALLRRFGGSASDPRRVRVDLQSKILLGEWWLPNSNVFQALKATNSPSTGKTLDTCEEDNEMKCSAQSSSDERIEQSSKAPSILFFVNVDVSTALIYQGTDRVLGSLSAGSALVVAPTTYKSKLSGDARIAQSGLEAHAKYAYLDQLSGVYTVRIDGVVRNTWKVVRGNETKVFYITQSTLAHLSS